MRSLPRCIGIVTLLTLAIFAAAQDKPATLSVRCDTDCFWRIDGVDQGALKKNGEARASVTPGQHKLEANSSDGTFLWEKTLNIEAVKVLKVKIELLRDAPYLANGLMWTKKETTEDLSWDEADAYCRDLKMGPYSGGGCLRSTSWVLCREQRSRLTPSNR